MLGSRTSISFNRQHISRTITSCSSSPSYSLESRASRFRGMGLERELEARSWPVSHFLPLEKLQRQCRTAVSHLRLASCSNDDAAAIYASDFPIAHSHMALSSVNGFLGLLDEDPQLRVYALEKLNQLVDEFWAEIAFSVDKM
jgi:hypothetical protein